MPYHLAIAHQHNGCIILYHFLLVKPFFSYFFYFLYYSFKSNSLGHISDASHDTIRIKPPEAYQPALPSGVQWALPLGPRWAGVLSVCGTDSVSAGDRQKPQTIPPSEAVFPFPLSLLFRRHTGSSFGSAIPDDRGLKGTLHRCLLSVLRRYSAEHKRV